MMLSFPIFEEDYSIWFTHPMEGFTLLSSFDDSFKGIWEQRSRTDCSAATQFLTQNGGAGAE
jgi:hypothetical protein